MEDWETCDCCGYDTCPDDLVDVEGMVGILSTVCIECYHDGIANETHAPWEEMDI